jgi:hypothetical protein
MNERALLSLPCAALVFLQACSVLAPAPTATPTSTVTGTPTLTSTARPTPRPPTETPDVLAALLPTGEPAASWNDIPIMAGALAGEGDEASYTFSIRALPAEVQSFYDAKLAALGWTAFAAGEGQNGALLLIYMKGQEMITLSIFPGEGITVVMFVK